ncbi:aminodeoxychorismate synthase component I, partial [candidate division KSB1 bacterium]|nr:aminodeoxychorismate synthase component I [candidate division KSB1 bacterium]
TLFDQDVNPPQMDWQPSIAPSEYEQALREIKTQIYQGNTYQVNFTYRLLNTDRPDPWQLFLHLNRAQNPDYGAFIDLPDWSICCASPELFFRLEGDRIESHPMKGTAARGLWSTADRRMARKLRTSDKDRAENIMIVDMVRNDLGRIAKTGSVSVPELCRVQRYPTVWQMVSVVRARTGRPVSEIIAALFPAASITGAPKRSTMHIIATLETLPRRIYTGTIGYLAPGRQAQFNVAIRTALVDKRTGNAEYGTGGGIVWDSKIDSEAKESRIKARILSHHRPSFDLLETLLWTPEDGYVLLDRHLQRMSDSADYIDFRMNKSNVRQELSRAAKQFESPYKIRLLMSRSGALRIESTPFVLPPAEQPEIVLAVAAVDSNDVFLYHKTTHRQVYEKALAQRPGYSDVLLYNEKNELTESTLANVVVEQNGQLYTPPRSCGLLAGTFRADMKSRAKVRERIIPIDTLDAYDHIYLINSVRGMWQVKLST